MVNLRRRKARQAAQDADEALAQDVADVSVEIVEVASATLGRPVQLAADPEPVIGGHGLDVFRFRLAPEPADDPRWAGSLLARWTDAALLDREVRWTRAVGDAGFPVPEIVAHEPERELLVLRDPGGKNLIECMLADMAGMPRLMAHFGALHTRLHALPIEPFRGGDEGTGNGTGGPTVESETVRQALADELAWLDQYAPAPGRQAVCHGELHPAHVYLDGGDPDTTVVVSWGRARVAEPESDVAFAMMAFWFSPYYLDNALYRKGMKMARDALASSYVDAYREASDAGLDDDRLRYWQAFHVGSVTADLAHRIHHGPRSRWDPMAGVVQPEKTLKELRERFWELARP